MPRRSGEGAATAARTEPARVALSDRQGNVNAWPHSSSIDPRPNLSTPNVVRGTRPVASALLEGRRRSAIRRTPPPLPTEEEGAKITEV